MPPLLNRSGWNHHRAAIERLTENAEPLWGGMRAIDMVCHLRALLEASFGDFESPRMMSPWIGKPVGFLFFRVFTKWPKGNKGTTPPVPALCPKPDASFDEERARLLDACERFVDARANEPNRKTMHPIMGPTTLKTWARAHGIHHRHHYRQFGLLDE